MKIHEKISLLLKEKGWKLITLHRAIEDLFEEHAIQYRTLLRTIHGDTKLRESTLFQIASALGKTPEEMRKDTDEQEHLIHYGYNKKAYLEIEANNLDFLTAKLCLLPGAKTETEQDPAEKGNFVKWIYGLRGEVTCILKTERGEERHHIKKNETFHFPSTYPHYFENNASTKAACILIQNPKYI